MPSAGRVGLRGLWAEARTAGVVRQERLEGAAEHGTRIDPWQRWQTETSKRKTRASRHIHGSRSGTRIRAAATDETRRSAWTWSRASPEPSPPERADAPRYFASGCLTLPIDLVRALDTVFLRFRLGAGGGVRRHFPLPPTVRLPGQKLGGMK